MLKRKDSALVYVLIALIPYSKPNLKLVFKPNSFFNDLERISNKKRQTLQNAYSIAKKQGLVVAKMGNPILSEQGELIANIYSPKVLNNAELLLIFDIPEKERAKRDYLRSLLKQLKFEQVQKSVWVTKYDFIEYLKKEITEQKLDDYVQIYEALRIYTK